MDEVRAATDSNRKKIAPINQPIGIWAKTEGSVTKVRPGPDPGSMPKANTAGNTISPPKIATPVSAMATQKPETTMFCDLGM